MDVNGRRFHLLSGAADWTPRLAGADLDFDEDRGAVGLTPRLFRFPERRQDDPLDLQTRRAAARDRHGNWFSIDHSRKEIHWRPAAGNKSGSWWSAEQLAESATAGGDGDFRPNPKAPSPTPTLAGLAVTEDHYLVVGTVDPGGLLVFDLSGGLPVWRRWPESLNFTPTDLSPVPGGGLWVLDQPPSESARLWFLDGCFRVLDAHGTVQIGAPRQADFAPQDTGVARVHEGQTFPSGIALRLAAPLGDIHPAALAALSDGSVLVLENTPGFGYSSLHRWSPPATGVTLLASVSLEGILADLVEPPADGLPPETDLRAHDMDQAGGDLYLVDITGNQAFVFALDIDGGGLELRAKPIYLPLRRFSGKGLVAAGDEVYYDLGERWIPLIEQPRARYERNASAAGLTFDGNEPGCVWHRLMLDAQVPPGDEISIESRAADRPELLAQMPWQSEPTPVLRASGSELPNHRPFTAGECHVPGSGTWELLFQRAVGRYLELRLSLRGSGRSTPRIRALRAYYPRFSYLDEYLPAVYREDAASASFLDRFLANTEGLFTALEGRIASAQTLFDNRVADNEYLDWLGGWLGAVVDPAWDENRRRLFITHAEKLFRWRGTKAGVERAIHLAIDPCPDESLFDGLEKGAVGPAELEGSSVRIVEAFHSRREITDQRHAHRFTVMVPARPEDPPGAREQRRRAIEEIVQREKPAHSQFHVELFWALNRVGEIRLGSTLPLGGGGRYTALALGASHVGESHLSHPWTAPGRRVLGRDPLSES